MPRILLVEDEPSIADTLLYALRSELHEVSHVMTGKDALALQKESVHDLAILDVGLPDMTGFELCRKLRETSAIPILFLTARDSELDRVLGLEIGGDDYVTKPFHVEEVLTKADTLYIVVKDDVNETLINTIKHIWESEKLFIVLQPLKRLQFNILEHILVPPHRVLTTDEAILVRKKYNVVEDSQFPDISRFDPVAQAIGIRPGDVCEIIRPSKTAISAPYYRICF
jgi:two-component system catabolic regulation response regulator CreB